MAALDEFIASFSKFGGHALANRFEVKITSPPAIRDPNADKHVSFRVEAFTMPGKNIRTVTNCIWPNLRNGSRIDICRRYKYDIFSISRTF